MAFLEEFLQVLADAYPDGTLSLGRIATLEEIPGWDWNPARR